jgi:FMNH2-dependent dimethyl sulfone monooxygenase
MQTCTWAPTVFQGTQVVDKKASPINLPVDRDLMRVTTSLVQKYEALGISNLLIAQRWWGNGQEIEASSLDCLAMTALFAGCTQQMKLITAIHPGFFQPAAIAKWGATLDRLTTGRWAINITSGWNMQEFDMYGIEKLTHDDRYDRSAEFIEVLRGAWSGRPFNYQGQYYHTDDLRLEPCPSHPLQVFQGGQSDAAISLAAQHSDWMFLNGGSPEKIANIIERARSACAGTNKQLRFAMYAAPLCYPTDEAAWSEIDARLARVDKNLVSKRRERVAGAEGMWADENDPLSVLDTNEGYASRLIGSPDTVMQRAQAFSDLGIDMLLLDVSNPLFQKEVLPLLTSL